MGNIGHKSAKELKDGIIIATKNLSSALEKVSQSCENISHVICSSWMKSLENIHNITKDFNSLIDDCVVKLLSSINKAIDSLSMIPRSMAECWLASLKEIENLVNNLPYVGQYTGEHALKYIGIAATEIIITKIVNLLQHPLTRCTIVLLLIRLLIANLQLLLALSHDPYFIYILIIAVIAMFAIYLWYLYKKYVQTEKPKEYSYNVEINQYRNTRLQNKIQQYQNNSTIDLRQEGLTDQDMSIVIEEAIINKQCKILCLSDNKITSTGVRILAKALNDNETLERLSLYGNEVSDDGVYYLYEALSNKNNGIKRLNLNKTGITDIGAHYLAQLIETNQTLTDLCLHGNEISDKGAQKLANAIKNHNATIALLRLSSNKHITDDSVDALIQMIEHNQSLRKLDVSDCHLSEIGREKLQGSEKLKTNLVIFAG